MDKYTLLINTISTQTKTPFHPASSAALATLRKLKVPESMINFYAFHEPVISANGQARLLPIADILIENTQAVPGYCIHPHGYIVFASTWTGSSYCFNTNKLNAEGKPEIILASHESISEDSTPEEIHRAVKPIAPTLRDFLEQFCKEELNTNCTP